MNAQVPELILPAPLWRRFAAAIYDALLLIGVWMGVVLVYVPLRDALGGDPQNPTLPALLFLAGAGFFGWSWTHGGRTPGLLAWNLQLRRDDGGAVPWPAALGRYAAMLATWALSVMPFLPLLPARLLARLPHPATTAMLAALLALGALVSTAFDGRRRAPCDWLSGTEVVRLPRGRARADA